MKTAVIAGASGLIGKQLMYKLLESPLYQRVVVLVRKKMPIKHDKLFQMLIDFDRLEEYKYQILGDDFFCCLGTTMKKAGSKEAFYKVDFTYCYELAKIAAQNQAQNFLLVSAVGSDANSSIYYSRVKGELEKAIRLLHLSHIHIFHPSMLLGDRPEFRLGEKIGSPISQLISPLFIGSLRKYKPIHAAQVANAMLNVAQNEEIEKVKWYSFDEMMGLQSLVSNN